MSLPCLYAFPPWILTALYRHQQDHLVRRHSLTKSFAQSGEHKGTERTEDHEVFGQEPMCSKLLLSSVISIVLNFYCCL